MPRHLLFAILIFACINIGAEDRIVLTDGNSIICNEIEVSPRFIFYLDSNAQLQRLSVDEVFAVKIGDNPLCPIKSIFEQQANMNSSTTTNSTVGTTSSTGTSVIYKQAAPDNDDLKAIFKVSHDFRTGKISKDKYTKEYLTFLAFTDSSIISNEDLTVNLRNEESNSLTNSEGLYNNTGIWRSYVAIQLLNKTNKTIYVDCGATMRINQDGSYKVFYDGKTYGQNTASGTSTGLNLGAITNTLGIGGMVGTISNGINVGRETSAGISMVHKNERILVIPPHAKATLPADIFPTKKTVLRRFEDIDSKDFRNAYKQEKYIEYKPVYLEEDENTRGPQFIISYYFEDDPLTQYRMQFQLYAYEIFGGGYSDKIDGINNGEIMMIHPANTIPQGLCGLKKL